MYAQLPDEAHNQAVIIGITTALISICCVLYCLRIFARRLMKVPLWIDDWWMLFALTVISGQSAASYIGV